MFSKSRRFPDGSYKYINVPQKALISAPPPVYFSAGKDYSSVPNEYNILLDEPSRFKRRGYSIQHTYRFIDCLELASSENHIIHQNISEVSLSSTTTSSARTSSDDHGSILNINVSRSNTIASTRKLPSPSFPDTVTNITEKQNYGMQIEIESLLRKLKNMEAIVETLEVYKKDTEARIAAMDLELADLRSINNVLRGDVNRHEAMYLMICKQLEEEQIINHDLAEKVQKDSLLICDLMQRLDTDQPAQSAKSQAQINDMNKELMQTKEEKNAEIGELILQIQTITERNDCQEKQMKSELHAFSQENQEMSLELRNLTDSKIRLESRLVLKDEEVDILLNKVDDMELELRASQKNFTEYREYIESSVIPYLRDKKRGVEEIPNNESKRVLTELYEVKKFINKQAQYVDELKANVYWLTIQNDQLHTTNTLANKNLKEQLLLTRKLIFHAHSLQGKAPPNKNRKETQKTIRKLIVKEVIQ